MLTLPRCAPHVRATSRSCLMLEPLQENQVRYLDNYELFWKLYILLEEFVSFQNLLLA